MSVTMSGRLALRAGIERAATLLSVAEGEDNLVGILVITFHIDQGGVSEVSGMSDVRLAGATLHGELVGASTRYDGVFATVVRISPGAISRPLDSGLDLCPHHTARVCECDSQLGLSMHPGGGACMERESV